MTSFHYVVAFIVGITLFSLGLNRLNDTEPQALQGGPGTINQLDQWRSTTTPFSAITTNSPGKNIYIPSSAGTSSAWTADTFCINTGSPDCITSWSAGGGDSVSIDGSAVVDPDFVSTGDIDFVNTSNTITANINSNATLTFAHASATSITATNFWGTASLATALGANGSNCSAGSAPLGVDASGASEGCFDVWTEAENTSAGYIANIVEDTTPQLGGSLDAQGNNITDLGDVTFKTGATGGTLRTGTSNADKFELQGYDVDGGTYVKVFEVDAGNNVTAEVFDESFTVRDTADETKRIEFELGGITTGNTRTLTIQDGSGTLAYTSDLHSAVTLAGQDYLSLSTQQITANAINPDNLASADFGDFTCNGTTCSLDTTYLTASNILNDLAQTSLADPNADQLVFWDDSDTQFEFISTLTNLSITGNTLAVSDSFLLNNGDTGTGTYDFSGATLKQHTYKSFTWPGTPTTTTATTTVPLGTAYTAESWNGAECYTTSGTSYLVFTDGTNDMNPRTATTTVGRFTLSTNNTFTASEKRYVEIGALTNAQLSCSLDITINN